MHRELGHLERAAACEREAKAVGERTNRWCWNEADGFYDDVLADGSPFRKKTLALEAKTTHSALT